VIELVKQETAQHNKEGRSFNIAESVMAQLPFFACTNLMVNTQAQKDISRYLYAERFNISPYKGSYGEQPKKWIEKSFLISNLVQRQKAKAIKNG